MLANEFVASCLITPIMHATQFEHIVKTYTRKQVRVQIQGKIVTI